MGTISQDQLNEIYQKLQEADDARKTTDRRQKIKRAMDKLEQVARNGGLLHPEKSCPECGQKKKKDVFVCDQCWETKDQDKLEQKHR